METLIQVMFPLIGAVALWFGAFIVSVIFAGLFVDEINRMDGDD